MFIIKVVRTTVWWRSDQNVLSIHRSNAVGEIPYCVIILSNSFPFTLCSRYLFKKINTNYNLNPYRLKKLLTTQLILSSPLMMVVKMKGTQKRLMSQCINLQSGQSLINKCLLQANAREKKLKIFSWRKQLV